MNRDANTAFHWIITILNKLNIPFQISGGLAAIAYGATRPLEDIDIDIPEEKFSLLDEEVKDFIIYGPECFKDESWDLLLMTLNYHQQLIDFSGAFHTKIFNKDLKVWQAIPANFSTAEIKNIFGLDVPVIAKDELLSYKKALARPVDLMDIEQLNRDKNQ
jgi:hypothetical protein